MKAYYEIAVGERFNLNSITYFYIGFCEWKIIFADGREEYKKLQRKEVKEIIDSYCDCHYYSFFIYEDLERKSTGVKIRLNIMLEVNKEKYCRNYQKLNIENVNSQFIEDEKELLRYWGWNNI